MLQDQQDSPNTLQLPEQAADTPSTVVDTPSVAAAPSPATTSPATVCSHGAGTPVLAANGREDDVPTPALAVGKVAAPLYKSPGTPQDLPQRPLSFAHSAGSNFATPEIPIASGMTPMTASDARNAQRHIPAWNRVTRIAQKQAPLVAQQVASLWAKPSGAHTWAKTPFLLLQGICTAKGWELSVRHEAEVRIGTAATVVATVNIPAAQGGQSFTGIGKNAGVLSRRLPDCAAMVFHS